ncbi:MAG: hypothetical protein RL120_02635, partial [Gammaproteobacteria bacterium]
MSIVALMIYISMAARAQQQSTEEFVGGTARLTYDDLEVATGKSRALISAGIKKLAELGLIEVHQYRTQNIYVLSGHMKSPWAKLPKKHLYQNATTGEIEVFTKFFNLRARVELNALKLYLLLLAFRDNKTNVVFITHPSINEYCNIPRNEIRQAISFLISHVLISMDLVLSPVGSARCNRYEIRGFSHLHAGNRT